MELIIKGGYKKLRQLQRELRYRCKRDKLELSLIKEEVLEEKEEIVILNTTKTVALIKAVDTIEGLKEFESDERVTVIKAVAARKEELKKE